MARHSRNSFRGCHEKNVKFFIDCVFLSVQSLMQPNIPTDPFAQPECQTFMYTFNLAQLNWKEVVRILYKPLNRVTSM